MKIVYVIDLSCGSEYSAVVHNPYDSDWIPTKDTKCWLTTSVGLYPKTITFDIKTKYIFVYFTKRFWFWQTREFHKFLNELNKK